MWLLWAEGRMTVNFWLQGTRRETSARFAPRRSQTFHFEQRALLVGVTVQVS
jgi:hypothetical protein